MILESKVDADSHAPIIDNSYKRHALRENRNEEFDEYPTMTGKPFDRSRAAEMMGYGNLSEEFGHRSDLITVQGMTEHGTAVDMPVSDELMKVFNKDYRPLMKSLESHRG